jgi:hypothetical protein
MTTVNGVMTPLLINRRVQTLVAVLAALAAGVLLGSGEVAALPRCH